MNYKKINNKRKEQLERFELYLCNAIDTLQANCCFSSDDELAKHLRINKQDYKYLGLDIKE